MKTPVALDYGGGSGSDEDDEEEVPSSDDEGVTTTTKEEEEGGANDAEDVGQQGRRRVEQQRLLASQKLAFVERVFMTTTASSTDEDSFERACREARLTRDDFIDACGERSRMGACGWCLCDRAPVAASSSSPTTTKTTTTTKRFEIDAGARKVRDAAFVRGFCSREHLSSAEALAIRLGKSADAVSAARGAATKSAAPRGGEADVLKEQVVERRRSVGSAAQQAKPGAASGSSASLLESDRMARAMSVDGFLPREARKKVEAQRETEKKETQQQQQQQQRGARSRAVTWNESEIQEIEASSAAKKEERAAADVATGVFYFDTYGEGKKPKEGEFIPSIGGRFAEGQLRTEPRETGGGEMTLDVRADVDEEQNGEPVETTTTTTKDAADGVAEVARKMLAATLTANPIPGFSDGDEGFDDDDDDEMSSIASSSEEEERMMAATAAPSVSQFGITWMAIDNMVTEATFALSRADGSFIDMLPSRDKYTTSVSEAWNENLAKYVPELCVKLGISSERRRIEQGLTTLLRTFSFERAVPPFTEQRWLFVTMLFVRVLVSSELVALGDVDLLSSEAAIAVRDAAGSTSEEVELLGQRLHGQGVS
jgi:hypothetical protein